jgi:hypothetical protein
MTAFIYDKLAQWFPNFPVIVITRGLKRPDACVLHPTHMLDYHFII